MHFKGKIYLITGVSLLLLGVFGTKAQTLEVISTVGGDTTVNEKNIAWTIGEPFTEFGASSDYNSFLSQGFHQSNIVIWLQSKQQDLDFNLSIFPNPATDFFFIKYNKKPSDDLKLTLTDGKGNQIFMDSFLQSPYKVDISKFAAGVYFLKVTGSKDNMLYSFKILKH